jgi:hypothetical protein
MVQARMMGNSMSLAVAKRFYRLDDPPYETDHQDQIANPIWTGSGFYVPAISCAVCGQTWSGSRLTYWPVKNPDLLKRLTAGPLTDSEWCDLAEELRIELNLESVNDIRPGDTVNSPTYVVDRPVRNDFVFVVGGILIAKQIVVGAITSAYLTGVRPTTPALTFRKRAGIDRPALYQLLITGKASRVGTQVKIECNHCKRPEVTSSSPEIDVASWDGSDFFIINENPAYIGITERARDVLAAHGFTNYTCTPILPNPYIGGV